MIRHKSLAIDSYPQGMSLIALVSCIICLASCSSSDNLERVQGEVMVDGAKADIGTIQFRPADNPGGRGEGAAINNGIFEMTNHPGIKTGKYMVSVLLSRKTGAVMKDPQRGEREVLQELELSDSPQEVELTKENAANLKLTFTTKKKK